MTVSMSDHTTYPLHNQLKTHNTTHYHLRERSHVVYSCLKSTHFKRLHHLHVIIVGEHMYLTCSTRT